MKKKNANNTTDTEITKPQAKQPKSVKDNNPKGVLYNIISKLNTPLLIFLCFITCIITILVLVSAHLNSIFIHLSEKTEYSRVAIENKINSFDGVYNAYNYFDRNESTFYSDMIATYLHNTGLNQKNVDEITDYIGDTTTYVLKNSTILYTSKNAKELRISTNDLSALSTIGYTYKDGYLYTESVYDESQNEIIINRWNPLIYPTFLNENKIIANGDYNVMIINDRTNRIVDASDEKLIGYNYTSNPASLLFLDNIVINFYTPHNEDLLICVSSTTSRDYTIVGYITIFELLKKLSYESIVQILIFLCVVILLTIYSIHLKNQRKTEIKEASHDSLEEAVIQTSSHKHLFKNFYLDKNISSHVSALFVIGLLLFFVGSFYVQLLLNYSEASQEGTSSLKQMKNSLIDNAAYHASIETYYETSYNYCAEMIAKILTVCENVDMTVNEEYAFVSPISTDDAIKIVKSLNISSLEVFDVYRRCVASSKNSYGYYLSSDIESDMECSKMIDNSEYSKVIPVTGSPNLIYVITRRIDNPGIIRLTVDTSAFNDLTKILNANDAVLASDFGMADKYFLKESVPDTLYYINAGGSEIKELVNSIDRDHLVNHYEGTSRINGINYYINIEDIEDMSFIYALVLSRIYEKSFTGLLYGIFGLLVIYLLLYLSSSIVYIHEKVTYSTDLEMSEGKDLAKSIMDEGFIKYINLMFIFTAIILFSLLIIDYRISEDSLLTFLLGNEWQKGFSIFSFTLIISSILMGKIFSVLFKRILTLVGNNIGSRGLTICRMLSGLSDVAIFLAVFVFCAIELGFDPTQLFASLGVTGVVFGLGAQNTVNDLLSGLFIIFEGNYKVGDWIDVNGWRGQVKEIGVRTTKVAYAGDVKIFKNSSLDGIVALSRTNSGVVAEIDVAYDTDLDYVLKLIDDSTELYTKELKFIVEGPKVFGVTKLGQSGVTIKMWALVEDEEYAGMAQRGILRITKKLMNDNNIEIPFNQLVIHNASDGK